MRYGLPSGAQFFLDIFCFALFMLFVGRLGPAELGASNIALRINSLAFLPMFGMSVATSALVGQRLGEDDADRASYVAWSSMHLGFAYMASIVSLYLIAPEFFLKPFAAQADPEAFAAMRPLAISLLRIVAIYSIFDMIAILASAALKGAGDTRFVMWVTVWMAWALMVAPTWIAVRFRIGGVSLCWGFLCLYIMALSLALLARFLGGKWRTMRVIEAPPAVNV